MTDTALDPGPTGRLTAVSGRDSGRAFTLANRHTRRVKWMRHGIVLGVLALSLGIVGYVFFDPFRLVLPDNMSVSGAGLNGSRVTMQKPKMSGFRTDGRPYDFTAVTAVQDLRKPNVLELNQLDAHVTMPDKTVAHIVAEKGLYDASKDLMDLEGNIHLSGASGYDVRMSRAHVQFKGGDVSTPEPVTVLMSSGSVSADAMTMVDNGKQITFVGHVHSVMQPPSQTAAAAGAPAMKETVQ
ncbi:LPS export ABC transporter periplasmic protein LptC [Lichenihabitans sp. Uapishka_5]|uniref:LPS export ABC transporter periplasmic protein LptC n=1 Tax=Lichenihabitans sp. Uapishka_5 TaxID=3037302 RepID=UPI0029E7CBA8|nr:LPS export ABC transporter periplasmic protein LptC [Lichenihabitans sp. Uapishka_5]MDX7951412.1 LPS export ABC transporter periplasmic protein LptC [Lichenihabitans sp. Uapishka_5]